MLLTILILCIVNLLISILAMLFALGATLNSEYIVLKSNKDARQSKLSKFMRTYFRGL